MTTTLCTTSSPGIRSARAADASPIRGRSSKTSTAPSTSPSTPADTAGGVHPPGGELQQGGLAGAVGAEDDPALALLDLPGDVVEQGRLTPHHAHSGELKDVTHGTGPYRLSMTGARTPCVRAAFAVGHARLGEGTPLEDAVRPRLPDIDHVAGDLDRLALWHDLGRAALLVALPAPGDLAGVPRASAEAQARRGRGGECVFVPGLGGMLVPHDLDLRRRPEGGLDVGTRVDWTAYDAEPVPRHRVEALEASQLERHLLAEPARRHGGHRRAGRPAVRGRRPPASWPTRRWVAAGGCRPGSPAARLGSSPWPARSPGRRRRAGGRRRRADGADATRRQVVLARLQRASERALADATNAACAVLAGWRPA